jgi:hypothetical protein
LHGLLFDPEGRDSTFSEKSVDFCQVAWHHIPEDINLQDDMKEVGGYTK